MKKIIIALVFLAVISPVFAQPDPSHDQSNVFYVNIPLARIYPTGLGYVVQYRVSHNRYTTVGLPREWFTRAAGKAEMINLPRGNTWPSMSVFFRDGEFSHVRVHVHRSRSHPSWGHIPFTMDVSMFFENTETLVLEF